MNDTLIQGRLMPVNTSPAHVLAVASNFGLAIVVESGIRPSRLGCEGLCDSPAPSAESRWMICRRDVPGGVLEYRAKLDEPSAA